MNIDTLLQENKTQVAHLLRRYRVIGNPTIETINNAHRQHGAAFMTQLMAILTPTSNFSWGYVGDGSLIDQAFKSQQQAAPAKGKFWNFWDNLLTRVDNTGKTIGQFKYDAAGNAVILSEVEAQQQQTQRTVLIIAAVVVIAIVAVLIFKKKG